MRSAPWRGSLEQTLRDENVVLGTGSPGPGVTFAVCALNPLQCVNGKWQPPPSPTPSSAPLRLRLPDVPVESALDIETISVDELEDRTLGEVVDQRVASAAFADYRDPRELWELNASRLSALDVTRSKQPNKEQWGPYDQGRIRSLRRRNLPPGFTLTVPVEKVRAFVALPRPLLQRDEERLSAVRYVSPGFNWNALEEVEAKAQAMQPPPPPPPPPALAPCDLGELKRLQEAMLKTVSFKVPPAVLLTPVNVGVVEEETIDVQHPAFGPGFQAISFLSSQPVPSPVPGARAPDCRPEMLKSDHATAVAGIIASRAAALGLGGLAPNAKVVSLSSRDDVVANQILAAFNKRVRIFNLSIHYDEKRPINIRQKINDLGEALFVVSAGNDPTDKKPVCESAVPYPAYPVCEGFRKNVLVVAATNLDGIALIEKTTSPAAPGSNWNDQLVHVAAPGTGFYAPGRDNTYVPVRGTSFATPLVTATAALLFAQGIRDPWLIKQRVIATADQRDSLLHKVYGAGLLNVERAVTWPQFAVLGTATPAKVADLEPSTVTITWQTGKGGSRTLPLSHVRRLTRNTSGTYRIIYFDDVTEVLVVQDDVTLTFSGIEYHLVDLNTGQPTGNLITGDDLGNYKDYVGPITF